MSKGNKPQKNDKKLKKAKAKVKKAPSGNIFGRQGDSATGSY